MTRACNGPRLLDSNTAVSPHYNRPSWQIADAQEIAFTDTKDRLRKWHLAKLLPHWQITEDVLVHAYGDDLWTDKFLQALRQFEASETFINYSFAEVDELIRQQRDIRLHSPPSVRGRGISTKKNWAPSDVNTAFREAGGIPLVVKRRQKREQASKEVKVYIEEPIAIAYR